MPDLLELADRVEAMEGPSREMFIEAWNAILGWEATSIKPGSKWQVFLGYLDAEAWLDAAMSLVPKGWTYEAFQGPSGQPHKWKLVRIGSSDQRYTERKGKASTPALALVAASLRAIAQEKGE